MRMESGMHNLQNLILRHFWGEDATLTPKSRDTPDMIAVTKDYVRPSLYHYTNIDTAVSILSSDDPCGFAFTHYKYLNDRDEYEDGLKRALAWMKRRGGAFLEGIQEEVRNYINKHKEDQSIIPYVLSFTTSADSTSQWMAYTDKTKGGVAIGLRFNAIESAIGKMEGNQMRNQHLSEILFAPCIYYMKSSRADEPKMFEEVLDAVFSRSMRSMNEDTHEQFVKWCAGRIFQVAALVKGEDYRFEKEWRLVIRPRNYEYAQDIQFIGGKPRLKPSELNLKSCINRIVISPHGDIERIRTMAELLNLRYGKAFRIFESHSSYDGGCS